MSVEGVSVDRPVVNVMDLIDRILDKGLVIDLYIRLALVGIELLEIQARIVISGVEKCSIVLHFLKKRPKVVLATPNAAPLRKNQFFSI